MEGFIKFLGTGGARFVASRQVRSTGGLWLKYKDTNLYIDPGPGAIVKVNSSKERLNPVDLDGIIISHKHLDHANDVNIMIEAMTEGGFKKRGTLFCPEDAIDGDSVLLGYVRKYLENITILKENGEYEIKDVKFKTPVRHIHPVETYGFFFYLNKKIGIITDSRYFESLPSFYRAEYLIVNVLRVNPIEQTDIIEHLALDDFIKITREIKPEKAIMTHFGLNMIKHKPHLIADRLKAETGIDVIAAYDGMKIEF
ncbi:MAG: MBL fold metallo-hydrolase [Syntrophorhabdaceae bacterium]|nr:MBL fold metallo-hydrolase [Syntrophorhabdaceae bacterium]